MRGVRNEGALYCAPFVPNDEDNAADGRLRQPVKEQSLYARGAVLKSLLNIILPDVCPFCEQSEQHGLLCKACCAELDSLRITGPVCVACGLPFVSQAASDHTCGNCLKIEMPFIEARSAFEYSGCLREAIHRFKYGERFILARPFGRMLTEAAAAFSIKPDIAVPVPLHKKRLRMRGFNQSLLLARAVSKGLSTGLDYLNLRRTKETTPQIELNTDERQKNVAGAFEVINPAVFKGRNVLLVDDVFTTGATVRECAKILKKTGASVRVLTLARAIQK